MYPFEGQKIASVEGARVQQCYMTFGVVGGYRFIDSPGPWIPITVSFLLLGVVSLRNVYIWQDCCVKNLSFIL